MVQLVVLPAVHAPAVPGKNLRPDDFLRATPIPAARAFLFPGVPHGLTVRCAKGLGQGACGGARALRTGTTPDRPHQPQANPAPDQQAGLRHWAAADDDHPRGRHVDIEQRPAQPGELCTCGRQAITVIPTPEFGDVGYCGIEGAAFRPVLPCPWCGTSQPHTEPWGSPGRCPDYTLHPGLPLP